MKKGEKSLETKGLDLQNTEYVSIMKGNLTVVVPEKIPIKEMLPDYYMNVSKDGVIDI